MLTLILLGVVGYGAYKYGRNKSAVDATIRHRAF